MESPQLASNTTTDSISSQLYGTHINRTSASANMALKGTSSVVCSAIYSGQQFIQFCVTLADKPLLVLRRVEDSYVNITQMLHILVLLNYFTSDQVNAFLKNEVVSNPQYLPEKNGSSTSVYADLSDHELSQIRGIWVPYDKAVAIAAKFDLYKLLRKLFLVDVHDYDKLPKFESPSSPQIADKRTLDEIPDESPTKKRKTSPVSSQTNKARTQLMLESVLAANTNSPSLLPPVSLDDTHRELITEVKAIFSEIFKTDGKGDTFYTSSEIAARFSPIFKKCASASVSASSILDIPLDQLGRTALHYASTLGSANLVGAFVEQKVCSPIRGDNGGESALVASIQVTNSMEKGNFSEILGNWLWTNLWLFDNKHQSILHHIMLVAVNSMKSAKFYFAKILEWVISNSDKQKNLYNLCNTVVNAKEGQDGCTALHWAGNNDFKWFVFLLLELQADPESRNNLGVKPIDFDCVKQVIAIRNKYKENPQSSLAVKILLEDLDANNDADEYLVLLVLTGVEFLSKLTSFHSVGSIEDIGNGSVELNSKEAISFTLHSSKILNSIQELLASTNLEFEKVIRAKKAEINSLNSELRDATILTANNRFVVKKVSEKINAIDSLKLQLANINEKLQMLKAETENEEDAEAKENDSELTKLNADEPYIIRPIYDKLVNNEPIVPTPELFQMLPSVTELKAQLAAYEELNSNLEREANCLLDYSALTSKFKKVVSFCTGVNVEEVDDLLDGLLEAVEGQQ